MNKNPKLKFSGLIYLFIIYLVWGSTYLAIRLAVREGSGFPPFMLGGTRITSAGLILLLWGVLRNNRLKPIRQEIKILAVSGVLMWVGANGLVNWSEQRTDSGLAALIIAATPLWSAIVTVIMDRELPSLRMVGALFVGFSGMAVLSVPVLQAGIHADVWSIFALLLAGLCWGTGTVIQSRKPVKLNVVVSAGYQQLIGGTGLLVIAFILDEPLPNPILEAWLAWGYLLVFGSLVAFTSFIKALRVLPTKIVMTYPFVNPVIAVFLGWLILDEPITLWTVVGAALILLGVVSIFRERYREPQ